MRRITMQPDILSRCVSAAKVMMLSVGSGDGSQQAAIVRSGHHNIVCTFYDSKPLLIEKYPCAEEHVSYLETHCRVLYEINAAALHNKGLGMFDLIFFTFPHTGVPNNQPDSVKSNQDLMRSFLRSASSILKPGGEVQITLKTGSPYDQWHLPSLLQEVCGVSLLETKEFDRSLYPGYAHRLTKGMSGPLKEVNDKGAQVYIFGSSASDDERGQRDSVDVSGKGITILHVPPSPLSDEEVAIGAHAVMDASGSRGLTVLDIRREFHEELRPDTRQLNRVLYRGAANGRFQKLEAPRRATSSKPIWRLEH